MNRESNRERSIDLKAYGLSERFEQEATIYEGLYLARVTEQHRELYQLVCGNGELAAGVSGKFAYEAGEPLDFPVVGDWVMIDRLDAGSGNAVIHQVLRRRSIVSRQAAGTGVLAQPIAANIDIIFICMSLNTDFNLRRAERYLTIAWDSMATPVIVLTKSDLCKNLQDRLQEITSVSMGVDVIACSAENDHGLSDIKERLAFGKTIAFIGSSGVGKSTLINRLMGHAVLTTKEIRKDDDKGRHATTHRQLLLLPEGGMVIDTPGMRELQIYTGDLSKSFEDIEELAEQCRFADCSHSAEPGCMIRKAIEDGMLIEERLESYLKLRQEMSYSGMNSRQIEADKINRMFGGKGELKRVMREIKNRDKNR